MSMGGGEMEKALFFVGMAVLLIILFIGFIDMIVIPFLF